MKPIYEIIGPDGKVHYRRPEGHPDIAEAIATEGYSARLEGSLAEEFPYRMHRGFWNPEINS